MHLKIRRCGALMALLWAVVPITPMQGEVKVEKVTYFNQPNCYKLSNGTVEVIVTTDIGPRIIRYGFVGQDNMLAELPETSVKTDLGEWKPWGGHRLWTAPEAMPRSYSPDNGPVEAQVDKKGAIRLTQPVEPKTGIKKQMFVTLDPQGTGVTVLHRLVNTNLWDIDVAPWALTIMSPGGTVILPQEPFRSHDDYLLPARPLVLWHFTDLSDPRWSIGKKFIRLKPDEKRAEPQKVGIGNKQGWAAYHRNRALFVKRFDYKEDATYTDYGCNNETYTAGSFVELETLGFMHHLRPGGAAEHTERWHLFRNVDIGTTEASVEAALSPLLPQTKK